MKTFTEFESNYPRIEQLKKARSNMQTLTAERKLTAASCEFMAWERGYNPDLFFRALRPIFDPMTLKEREICETWQRENNAAVLYMKEHGFLQEQP